MVTHLHPSIELSRTFALIASRARRGCGEIRRAIGASEACVATLAAAAVASSAAPAHAAPGDTELVSTFQGAPITSSDPNGESHEPALSADGRYVAFRSIASNFVGGDGNLADDVFVRDQATGGTVLVSAGSAGSAGAQADGVSARPAISADGRYVAFDSSATNLVADDWNYSDDVFVRDLVTGQTQRVSLSSAGVQSDATSSSASISADGRFIAFESDATALVDGDLNGMVDVFVHDRATAETRRVSVSSAGVEGGDASYNATLSADGRYVAFRSYASNLVASDTNAEADIFVHDLVTHETTRVSVATSGAQARGASASPSLSADGRYVAFESAASNLGVRDTNGAVDVFVHDRETGSTVRASVAASGAESNADSAFTMLSGDGRYVSFSSYASNLVPGDGNDKADVFVRDLAANETARVSVDGAGAESDGDSGRAAMSADGRYVAFDSVAGRLASGDANRAHDVFVRDRATSETRRIAVDPYLAYSGDAPSESGRQSVSGDGRYVAFWSDAGNLVAGDANGVSDVLVRDRATGVTALVSAAPDGTPANDASLAAAISADGRYVAFESDASNLVADDSNGVRDVFVRDLAAAQTLRVSVSGAGAQGGDSSFEPSISADGRFVAFFSYAANLVRGDTNGVHDVFVHDRLTGETTRVSLGSGGAQANDGSLKPSISADGRYVAFDSLAANLVRRDTNGMNDVFVHDRVTGATVLASAGAGGAPADAPSYDAAISADGQSVAFWSFATNLVAGDVNDIHDVFVRDLAANETTLLSVNATGEQGNGGSGEPVIGGGGRYVVFTSFADNLVTGDTIGVTDVFVHDRATRQTSRVTVSVTGEEADQPSGVPAVSADGRFAVFSSEATNLTPLTPDTNNATDVLAHELPAAAPVPIASPQSVRLDEDGAVRLQLAGNAPNGAPVTYAIFDSPKHGSLSGTLPNVEYAPDPNFYGTDRFSFVVADGSQTSAPAAVEITIRAVNDAPRARPMRVVTRKNTPVRIRLRAADADRDPIDFRVVAKPVHGTLAGKPPRLVYIPRTGFSGVDVFGFTVGDGKTASAPVKVRVHVRRPKLSKPRDTSIDVRGAAPAGATAAG